MAQDEARNGLRLRGGLPDSNGLSPLAGELIKDKTRLLSFVGVMRVAAITHNVENDSRTASMKIVSIEADLIDEERDQINTVLERARVRRTGEEPLFTGDGDAPPTPIRGRRNRR